MQVIPVLDLLDGHVVHAVRGERSRYRPIRSSLCATSDPIDIAHAMLHATGARTLYVADLGAILDRGAHVDVLAALCVALGEDVAIWLDAGFSDFASMRALFERVSLRCGGAAASLVPVFGTETLTDARAIAEADAAGYEPILSLDYRGGRALGASHGDSAWWPARVIVMTLDRVGAHDGPDMDTFGSVRAAAGERCLIGAGGVRHGDDVALVGHAGAWGWLVGSAIHELRLGRSVFE
ncbi:HisA/HisF-related TIM barrel protein [Caballeronia concitans]|uniref:1-(5-phosphoribosyl)-5-[(5-phosphoribosylamino)methylideneamino] imidazole-4-carboxamide isomerase n=1 Tax=Caballeronia concitans TaxID=1777133 RepID=A0A658R121_9BURK|nr:HisA/HisF-related TIM barrel protein [Caballeronia concitans]KIG10197.1 histidine biosynthesis protein [Burkholderia sp. MR1]SAL37418.1 1-(5-phosphoribosyl)-5-[(5-phosphoribosylamino)methylideneamino] imidazole-4-carboxamide isomerase [Caballeronia concitans]